MCRVRTRKISVHLRASSFSRSTNSTFHGAVPAFSRATAAGSSNRRGPAQLIERRALLNSLVAVKDKRIRIWGLYRGRSSCARKSPWFAKMISQTKTLTISYIEIGAH